MRAHLLLSILAVIGFATHPVAPNSLASAPREPQIVRLWPGQAPGAHGDRDEDTPTLTVYMPPNTTGPMTGGDHRARRQLSHACR